MIMIRTLRRDIARYNKEEEMVSMSNIQRQQACLLDFSIIPRAMPAMPDFSIIPRTVPACAPVRFSIAGLVEQKRPGTPLSLRGGRGSSDPTT